MESLQFEPGYLDNVFLILDELYPFKVLLFCLQCVACI